MKQLYKWIYQKIILEAKPKEISCQRSPTANFLTKILVRFKTLVIYLSTFWYGKKSTTFIISEGEDKKIKVKTNKKLESPETSWLVGKRGNITKTRSLRFKFDSNLN